MTDISRRGYHTPLAQPQICSLMRGRLFLKYTSSSAGSMLKPPAIRTSVRPRQLLNERLLNHTSHPPHRRQNRACLSAELNAALTNHPSSRVYPVYVSSLLFLSPSARSCVRYARHRAFRAPRAAGGGARGGLCFTSSLLSPRSSARDRRGSYILPPCRFSDRP
jgi:hypothetical protein